MRATTLLGIVFGAGGIAYVITYFIKQKNLLSTTDFKYAGGKILNFGWSNIKLRLYLEIYNKSNVDLTITNQNYDVFISNQYAANINSSVQQLLPKYNKASMSFDVSFNPAEIIKISASNIRNYLLDKSKIKFKIKGKISLHTGMFYVSRPVDIEKSLTDFSS